VETPSGMVGKKAHTCHLHHSNALYSTLSLHVTSTQSLRRKNLQLLHIKNGFYAILIVQEDADSNQQTASPKVKYATYSATRLGKIYLFSLKMRRALFECPLCNLKIKITGKNFFYIEYYTVVVAVN
jgi:hypothetical protein